MTYGTWLIILKDKKNESIENSEISWTLSDILSKFRVIFHRFGHVEWPVFVENVVYTFYIALEIM